MAFFASSTVLGRCGFAGMILVMQVDGSKGSAVVGCVSAVLSPLLKLPDRYGIRMLFSPSIFMRDENR